MIIVVVAVVGATALGIACERRSAAALAVARRTLGVMLYVLLPFVSYVNIAHLRVTVAGGLGLVFGYVMVAAVGVSAWAIGRFALRLPAPRLGAVICSVIVVNSGYLGYPMTVALLGSGALGSAVAYDQLVSGPSLFLIGFAVGAVFGTAAGASGWERARAFLTRNPPLLAVIAGLLVPAAWAPAPLPAVSHVVVWMLLVLGFFAVGVYLSSERREDMAPLLEPPDSPVVVAVGLRMIFAPAILLVLSTLIVRVPSAYLLEAAMPTGVSALIVGHAFGLDQRLLARIIVWGTTAALIGGLAATVV